MKVAVASVNKAVAEHFGHCDEFCVYEADGSEIKGSNVVKNPPHQHGFLPAFLADMGVNAVIAGGMGGSAAGMFAQRGIDVIMGASGDARTAAESYLKGELRSSGSVCNKHEHAGECGGHCHGHGHGGNCGSNN